MQRNGGCHRVHIGQINTLWLKGGAQTRWNNLLKLSRHWLTDWLLSRSATSQQRAKPPTSLGGSWGENSLSPFDVSAFALRVWGRRPFGSTPLPSTVWKGDGEVDPAGRTFHRANTAEKIHSRTPSDPRTPLPPPSKPSTLWCQSRDSATLGSNFAS